MIKQVVLFYKLFVSLQVVLSPCINFRYSVSGTQQSLVRGKAAFVLHDSASITDLKDKGEKLEKQKMSMSEKQKFAPEM